MSTENFNATQKMEMFVGRLFANNFERANEIRGERTEDRGRVDWNREGLGGCGRVLGRLLEFDETLRVWKKDC